MMIQEIQLTEEQEQALEFLRSTDSSYTSLSLLSGSAGTGKTTVVCEYARTRNRPVILTAPTHKAVKVLHSKLADKVSRRTEFMTLHSFLGIKRNLNYKTGLVEFVPDKYANLRSNCTVIIDEASMISTDLLTYVKESAGRYNNRFIFVGDHKQLNPVGEEISPVFDLEIPEVRLNTILRQAEENDNIWLSNNLKHLLTREDGKNFRWGNLEDAYELLVDSNGTDKAKFITWTNDTITKINKEVRKRIYEDPAEFELGEIILFKEQYESKDSMNVYINNHEVEVTKIEEDICNIYGYDIFYINNDIRILKNKDKHRFKKDLADLSRKCVLREENWTTFYKMKETYAQIQYNHAITVHKSQGSTYGTGIVNISEMLRNPNLEEKRRMIYTALTRTSGDNILL